MNIFDGPEGESLLTRPILEIFRHNPLPALFRQAEHSDDRLMAILTAIVVEGRIDECLTAFMPLYSSDKFSFYFKIQILKSLDLVPRLLLTAAELTLKVRNQFAHNLERSSFDSLPPALQSKLKLDKRTICSRFGNNDTPSEETLREVFQWRSFFVIAGLDAYTGSLSLLRREISQPVFMDALYAKVAAENDEMIEALLRNEPELVEERYGIRINSYGQGRTSISSPKAQSTQQ